MSIQAVVALGQQTLLTVLLLAGPVLAAILLIGLAIGVFQAVTSIHEATLTFVPKMLAAGVTLALCMPWMLQKLMDFTTCLLADLILFMR